MSAETKDRLVKKKEVASVLSVSTRMVDRLASVGKLSCVRVLGAVRFRMSEIQALIEGKDV